MPWIDVSMAVHPGLTVWPEDPPVTFAPVSRIADGDSCNVSLVSCNTHTGTHCDAPWHFEPGGARLHEIDPAVYFGDALVIDLPGVEAIDSPHLPAGALPPRVLFRTRNSDHPQDAPFDTTYVALTPAAAARLVADGVQLAGVDGPSVAPYGDSGPVHHVLLRAGIFVVENLRLASIPPGVHPFVVLPMPLRDLDGAPCRAFVYCA
jgi:arylformamidase